MNEIIDELAAELSGEKSTETPEIVEETIVEPTVIETVPLTPPLAPTIPDSVPLPQDYVEPIPEFNFFADHAVTSAADGYLVNQNADFITQLTGEIVSNIVLSTQIETNKVVTNNKQSISTNNNNNTKNNRSQRRKRPDREQVVDYPIGSSSTNYSTNEIQQLPTENNHVVVEEQLMTVHDASSESQKEKKLFKKNNKSKKPTVIDTIPVTVIETKTITEEFKISKPEESNKTLKEKKRLKKLTTKVDSTDSKPMSYSKAAAESTVDSNDHTNGNTTITITTNSNSDNNVKLVRQSKKKFEKVPVDSVTTDKPTDSVALNHTEKPKQTLKMKKVTDDVVVTSVFAPVVTEVSVVEKELKPKFDRSSRPKTAGKEYKPREFRTQNNDITVDNKVNTTEKPRRDYDKPKREYKPREERITVDENGVPTASKPFKPRPKKVQEQPASQPVVNAPTGITEDDDWEQKQSKRTKQLLKNLETKVPSPTTQNKPKTFVAGGKPINKAYPKPKPVSG